MEKKTVEERQLELLREEFKKLLTGNKLDIQEQLNAFDQAMDNALIQALFEINKEGV